MKSSSDGRIPKKEHNNPKEEELPDLSKKCSHVGEMISINWSNSGCHKVADCTPEGFPHLQPVKVCSSVHKVTLL